MVPDVSPLAGRYPINGGLSYVNLALSICILVGLLVSYLPQHYRIINRRTSEGISPYFILLGTTSGTATLANILLLPASREDIACCKVVSPFECFAGLLGIAQVATQWTCFTIILLLFLVFFPRGTPATDPPSPEPIKTEYTWRVAVSVALLCLLHGLVVVLVTILLAFFWPNQLGKWANLMGVTAGILAMIQYFPQIWTTYHLRHVGSLSIPMMVIQTPGSFLWVGSLIARLGAQGWSIWGVYIVTGCLQGTLLVMGVYFELEAKKLRDANGGSEGLNGSAESDELHFNTVETDDEGAAVVENGRYSERTPLLKKNSKPIT